MFQMFEYLRIVRTVTSKFRFFTLKNWQEIPKLSISSKNTLFNWKWVLKTKFSISKLLFINLTRVSKNSRPYKSKSKIIEFVIYFESNFMVSQNNIILYTWYLSKSLSLKIICLLHPLIRHTVFLIRIQYSARTVSTQKFRHNGHNGHNGRHNGHKTDWLWSVDLCTRLCIKARKLNNLWCLDYVKHIAVSQKCIFINLETICEHELELFRAVYVVMRYSSVVYPHILSIFGHFWQF